ncbi:YbgF trimerization domain-containing protein [Roseicella sp. DB1501]|uniref:YbgF trimerization domain-containing protein n=1 Tax=Roseicella sp. DB1501 TaxID=2730925 RepID=UPI0014929F01|nr:tetratricopeptide repeat protein [Roseicella sp. DB1501]NOG68844.1 tetratricopeptide repeat protein [Roseicella sp. DB1501]
MRRALAALLLATPLLLPGSQAWAQAESREGIYLQNQILQLRQELDQLRRGGGAAAIPAPMPRGAAPGAPQGELVGALLDRVSTLEEETRRLRGRLDQAEYQNRTLMQQVEKLQGDLDYRLQQVEGGAPRSAPAAAAPPPRSPSPAQSLPPVAGGAAASAPAAAARTPERALAEGQAALSRRDYAAAEAAAKEVLAARGSPRSYDARLLLADAEYGQRNWQDAAVAYGEAYKANQKGSRAAEALIGFGSALANLNQKREACDAFALVQSEHPQLRGPLKERLEAGRQRAGCR